MIHINTCPVCDGTAFTDFLITQDYTVSQERFTIQQCNSCGFLITSPRPADQDLGRYYESDAYISHAQRPKTITDRVYWLAREFALRTKYNLIRKTNPRTMLDYGCGTGAFLSYCQKKGLTVTGVEPSAHARHVASTRIAPRSVYENVTSLTEPFDTITLWHVLEHVPNLNETIAHLHSLLHGSGTLFIAVPNITSWESSRYGKYWAAYDVPRHLWHFNQNTISQLFQRHNLELKQVVPMKLDAYYVSLLSEKYKRQQKSTAIGMINAVKNGLISNINARKTGAYSSLIYIFQHA